MVACITFKRIGEYNGYYTAKLKMELIMKATDQTHSFGIAHRIIDKKNKKG